jgi:hypothetical protein
MYRLHVTYRYYCQILMKLEFSRQSFEKNFRIENFMKIRLLGAEFHADGNTDRQTDRRTDGQAEDRHDESTSNSRFSQPC